MRDRAPRTQVRSLTACRTATALERRITRALFAASCCSFCSRSDTALALTTIGRPSRRATHIDRGNDSERAVPDGECCCPGVLDEFVDVLAQGERDTSRRNIPRALVNALARRWPPIHIHIASSPAR
jgi:hypothetical protein